MCSRNLTPPSSLMPLGELVFNMLKEKFHATRLQLTNLPKCSAASVDCWHQKAFPMELVPPVNVSNRKDLTTPGIKLPTPE